MVAMGMKWHVRGHGHDGEPKATLRGASLIPQESENDYLKGQEHQSGPFISVEITELKMGSDLPQTH